MRYQVFLFLCLSNCLLTFSQESSKRWRHQIAFGPAQYFNTYSGYGHDNSGINYNSPGYSGFYRLIRNGVHHDGCMTVNASYRDAYGYTSGGGMGGGNSTKGNAQWMRVDIGLSQILKFGRYKGFGIGGGAYVGALAYTAGKVNYSQYDAYSQYTVTKDPRDILSPVHFGCNLEILQMIRFSERFRLVIGARAGIETSDGFRVARGTKYAGAYLGFYFFGKEKEKTKEKRRRHRKE